MIRKIIAGVLFLTGTVIFIFFENYKGSVIPYPDLIWLSAFVMYGVGFLLFRSALRSGEKQLDQTLDEHVEVLKKKGERVKVLFSDCEIRENNYVEEKEKYGANDGLISFGIARDVKALDALIDETRNTTRTQVNQTVLIYKTDLHGSPVTFVSPVLSQDRATLIFKLDDKKETIIYVNRNNPREYFFDLDFL